MRYHVTVYAVQSCPHFLPTLQGKSKVVAKDAADAKAKALEAHWDIYLSDTCTPRVEVSPLPRYLIVESWDHIFAHLGNRTVRFIYDYETGRLENLELLHSVDGWTPMADLERKDVEDSLKNANAECLDEPKEWGYCASNDLPAWAKYVPVEVAEPVEGPLYPKVVVLCTNAFGAPEFHTCAPEVSQAAYDEGAHYELAKEHAEHYGYDGSMHCFDENDPAARQLADVLKWLTPAEATVAVGTDAEAEAAAENAWVTVCNQQAWNRDSQICHLEGFLREKGLFAEFAAYAQRAADEERS